MLMSYVDEDRDGLPNNPVPQKARRTMTNLRTRLKTSSVYIQSILAVFLWNLKVDKNPVFLIDQKNKLIIIGARCLYTALFSKL